MEKNLHQEVGVTPASLKSKCMPSSLTQLLLDRCKRSFDRPAIIDSFKGEQLCWGQLLQQSVRVAKRLEEIGLKPGDRVLHVGLHSAAWPIVDFACLLSGVVHVALHAEESQSEQVRHLHLFQPRGLIFSGGISQRFGMQAGLPFLDVQEDWHEKQVSRAFVHDSIAERARECDPDEKASILISSGTTGRPKGFVHSQRSLAMNAVASAAEFLEEPDDVRLSWLPQSHALARIGDLYTTLVRGGALNIVRDRKKILEACERIPPAVILGVPIFYDRLARAAQQRKFARLGDALGGRIRVCVSGGAPLRRWTTRIFKQHGVPLVEGYGLAEAGPVVAVSNPRCKQNGAVGYPLEGVEIAISNKEVCSNESGCSGEILVRTPCRAISVIDPSEGTEESVVDRTAWLATGDIGSIDNDGQLRIAGRIDDVLTLSNGTKLLPADVERVLLEEPAVAQVCVAGEGLPWPVAFIVPEPLTVRALLKKFRCRVWSRKQALSHPRILRWFSRRLSDHQKDLPQRECVRRFVLVDHPFDTAHGEATESFKIKRRIISKNFASYIHCFESQASHVEKSRLPGVGIINKKHHRSTETKQPNPQAQSLSQQTSLLTSAFWGGTGSSRNGGGFADAAEEMAAGIPGEISAILNDAKTVIENCRNNDELYDKAEGPTLPAAPLADPPLPPTGKLSARAEQAIGRTGLWGLLVPQAYGGLGCTCIEFMQAITHLAGVNPTVSGLLSVHSTIGAVSALTAFGSEDQRAHWLPQLARGDMISVFAATEPDAGCDLHRVASQLEYDGSRYLLTGTKMFITGATYGRLVKLLAISEGKPVVVLVKLPHSNTPQFLLQRYGLHPLKHAHNNALTFKRFPVDSSAVLRPEESVNDQGTVRDGMSIVWHGLNRGRVSLAAQAAGTISVLLNQAVAFSGKRYTWGQPIQKRELVLGRLGRMASARLACEALSGWSASVIDGGGSGELEAILAKVVASRCLRQAAVDALGIHGGRAFLVGHPLGDSFHDHFAAGIYEGESDLLGLALFKGIAKHHPLASSRKPLEWLRWRSSQFLRHSLVKEDTALLDGELRDLATQARRGIVAMSVEADQLLRRYGKNLSEQQLTLANLSVQIQDLISCLATIHLADRRGDSTSLHAAVCWCRPIIMKFFGKPLASRDHKRLAELGRCFLVPHSG